MEEFRLTRDGQKDLIFTGNQIASGNTITPSNNTRWIEMALYKTKGGKFIMSHNQITRWQGEESVYEATVYQNMEDLKRAFSGDDAGGRVTDLLKEIAEQAARVVPELDGIITETVD